MPAPHVAACPGDNLASTIVFILCNGNATSAPFLFFQPRPDMLYRGYSATRRFDVAGAGGRGGAAALVPPFIFLDAPFGWLWDRGVKGVRC